jgi:endonuclease/exonuclease/phosphatase (EEP) superfamily protein YafD
VTSRLRAVPPFTALGVLWPAANPWARAAAAGVAEPVPDGARSFRLVSSNALGNNKQAAAYASTITAIATDVLIVVEASDLILDALDRTEVSTYHRHGHVEKRDRGGGCGIWTDHHMEVLETGDAGYAYIAARVSLPAGDVTFIAVHTVAPTVPGAGKAWQLSFDELADVVARVPGPVVAAGDYNATMGHPPLPAFLARTGMTDAHTRAGRGLARSWPSSRVLPPLGLLDRVLITPDISVVAIDEREVPGSDHLTVVSELALA